MRFDIVMEICVLSSRRWGFYTFCLPSDYCGPWRSTAVVEHCIWDTHWHGVDMI